MLSEILPSRALAAIGAVCSVLAVYALLWGAVKLAWQHVFGRPIPRNRLTMTLDVLADVAVNVLGAVARAVKFYTGRAIFWPTVTPPPELDARHADNSMPEAPASPETIAPAGSRAGDAERGRTPVEVLALVLAVAAGIGVARCSASSVETQAAAADRIARVMNGAAPVALAEAEHAAEADAVTAFRLCAASPDAGPGCYAVAHAAHAATRARWRRVFVAWDAVGAAQSAWRAEILRCRGMIDAGATLCSPPAAATVALVRAGAALRCAVVAVGRADLDPLREVPGVPACTDGGAP